MTVPIQNPSISYVGNGATNAFAFPFTILESADLVVLLDGVPQFVGSQYTIDGIGNQSGGTATFVVVPLPGAQITLYRDVSIERDTDYQDNGDLLAKTVNADFDRLWMAIQDADFGLDRAVRVPRTDINPNMVLPPASLRANKALGFDNNGNPFAIELNIGSILTPVVHSLALARFVSKFLSSDMFVTDYYLGSGTGGGQYTKRYDNAPGGWENGGTRFVAADGAAWELVTHAPISIGVFGARIDGATNDTDAVQRALTNCLDVYHPGGSCLIDPVTLTGLTAHRLTGTGMRSAYFTLASSGAAFTLSNCQNLFLHNFGVRPNGPIANANGIVLKDGSNINTLSFVQAVDFTLSGVVLQGTSGLQLSGNRVTDCLLLGNHVNNLLSVYSNDFYYHKNQFGITGTGVTPQVGAYLQNSGAGSYTENYHWQNTVGLRALSSNYNRFENNRIEINEQQGAYFDSCVRTTFLGNDLHSNSTSSPGTYDDAYFINCDTVVFSANKIFTWDNAITQRFSAFFDTGCNNISIGGANKCPNGWTLSPFAFAPSNVNNIITGDFEMPMTSGPATPVAANSIVYLGIGNADAALGKVAVPNGTQRQLVKLIAETNDAPGGGQKYAYTFVLNGEETDAVLEIDDGGFITSALVNDIRIPQNAYYCVKLQTTPGATPTYHRISALFASY
ncbi:right-handed parallel beta-helix repeat-containing protein [Burkholderia gladioli]|uniref:right-handed parallel beta-helix repeat-containing protein n=1 Tax=Burkholderia gladioli TaxID=28095 RepID=UPI0016412159|nr:right-handed parallel beta-helix repeat-containing protein [Burkholderia gladioli]